MTKRLIPIRGTSVQHQTYVGEHGEITVNTTERSLVVHDGETVGGYDFKKSLSLPNSVETIAGRNAGQLVNDVDNLRQTVIALPNEIDAVGIAKQVTTVHNRDYRAHPELSSFITAEADRASESATIATVAALIYPDVGSGLTATIAASKQYFAVVSSLRASYVDLYKVEGGQAINTGKSFPSGEAISDIGIENLDSSISGLAFAVVDENGKRTWIETDLEGKPTNYAMDLIKAGLPEFQQLDEINPDFNTIAFGIVSEAGVRSWLEFTPAGIPTDYAMECIQSRLPAPLQLEEIQRDDINDVSFVITDEYNKQTWLGARKDGTPTPWAEQCIRRVIEGGGDGELGTATDYVAKHAPSVKFSISSGPNIVGIGDSMTAGAGGGGTTYLTALQNLLTQRGSTAICTNRGVGGETSVTICARMNGNPLIVKVDGGVIPASGQVGLTLEPINGYLPAPLKQGSSSLTCTLGGVVGTFGRTVNAGIYSYHFTRTGSGAAVTANRPLPLYTDIGKAARNDIYVIWIGQNGPNNERAISDAKAMIQYMSAVDKRFIVISKPGGGNATDADDARWFAEFGRRFIPIRQYMVKYGLEDAGIVPTEGDLTDIANGTVPRSLRIDSVHWTAAGYTILGRLVFERLIEFGWV